MRLLKLLVVLLGFEDEVIRAVWLTGGGDATVIAFIGSCDNNAIVGLIVVATTAEGGMSLVAMAILSVAQQMMRRAETRRIQNQMLVPDIIYIKYM